jgi:hypothetical protein
VRPYLADPKFHWKRSRSAYELAHSWIGSRGIPEPVRAVLATDEVFAECELVEGLFEREVDLRTPGRRSQTDLLALVRCGETYAVIAVEGKAGEAFGPRIDQWNTSEGKKTRIEHLSQVLGISLEQAVSLRYQLFHRAASAVFEAERYGATHALMLVHAFGDDSDSFDDFRAFADALGVAGAKKGSLTTAKRVGNVDLRLGWVAESPRIN